MSGVPPRVDAVVIGAGMGGLACAARLARAGFDTLLVEQDRRVGGTASSYVRAGFTIPAGPLGVTVPAFIGETLASCGVTALPSWTRSEFRLRTDRFDVALSRPLEELGEHLVGCFPKEEHGIREVVSVLAGLVRASRDAGGAAAPPISPEISADEFCRRHLVDEALVRLFSSQGSERSTASLAVMARMWDFLGETGIWYPSCGIHGLGVLLERAFRAAGGRLLLGRGAERILVGPGGVAGVRLAGGEEVRARAVVSGADYVSTVETLLDDATPGVGELRRAVASRGLSGSVLSVAAGVDTARLGEPDFCEPNLLFTRRTGDPLPWPERDPRDPISLEAEQIWISRVSRLDPGLAPPGRELWVLRIDAPHGFFSPYRRPSPPHAPEYYALKEAIGEAVVRAAAGAVPGLERSAEVLDVATPLTYEFRGHRTRGSVAGWAWSGSQPEDYTALPVRGLSCVGICAFSQLILGGMGTALQSGLAVAARVSREHRAAGRCRLDGGGGGAR